MTHEELNSDGDEHGYLVIQEPDRTICAFRREGHTYAISCKHKDGETERRLSSLAFSMKMALFNLDELAKAKRAVSIIQSSCLGAAQ